MEILCKHLDFFSLKHFMYTFLRNDFWLQTYENRALLQ